jgi:hypothetical protein
MRDFFIFFAMGTCTSSGAKILPGEIPQTVVRVIKNHDYKTLQMILDGRIRTTTNERIDMSAMNNYLTCNAVMLGSVETMRMLLAWSWKDKFVDPTALDDVAFLSAVVANEPDLEMIQVLLNWSRPNCKAVDPSRALAIALNDTKEDVLRLILQSGRVSAETLQHCLEVATDNNWPRIKTLLTSVSAGDGGERKSVSLEPSTRP